MSEKIVTPAIRPRNGSKQLPKGQNAKNADERQKFVLARLEEVRALQRAEGNFDCFGRAGANYCDQKECLFHAECLSVSTLIAQSL